ncbi:hypothetical protein FHP25_33895 [Vineibacter terrae]|uniref:Uncharacterized protein n=1 Tax=Vineibacter terrae TaxID=2586908 RepID=A0A5C8P9V2_9HYPH|nr:hypothetical protein [Vineibacter terrae]TXL70530.1 hypothetical protein FHP25_33895 [Vineibacter terrae]
MSVQARRARYVPVEQGFNIVRPSIAPQAFEPQKACAFATDAATGIVPLDLSSPLVVLSEAKDLAVGRQRIVC